MATPWLALAERLVLTPAENVRRSGLRALALLAAPALLGWTVLLAALFWTALPAPAQAPATATAPAKPRRYYAREGVEDAHGVIAPWYRGLNGQLDLRVRIAAETIKRYPWALPPEAVAPAPAYVYSGTWAIAADGKITVPPLRDWDNGDLGQRAAYVLSALVDYYRYSGDAAAIAHISLLADTMIEHFQTPPDHPWPRFLVSCPTRGKPYGKCHPRGMIQLDIVAEVGLALVRAYELAGNERWLETAKHWADLLAAHRSLDASLPPWNRYANPEDVPWEDQQTGGVAFILAFLDEILRVGHAGEGGAIVKARDAGRAYLRDELLPRWTVNDVWGRNYWDWPDPVQAENVTEFVARYLIANPGEFPGWRADARNVLSLFLNHTSVAPESGGGVQSGAWAYPESSGCCGRSLGYGPMELSTVFAEYGAIADSEWGREMARRQAILATYDVHETGVVEDNIDGGQIVAGGWFKIAHPMALKHALGVMAWLPDVLGASRENHLLRSSSVVSSVVYGKGRIAYATFDAPRGTVDVLRLAFRPRSVVVAAVAAAAAGGPLALREDLRENGYTARDLPGGDCIVSIRHDGEKEIVVEGDDPQEELPAGKLAFSGEWRGERAGAPGERAGAPGERAGEGGERATSAAGAAVSCVFSGNQVRVIGSFGPDGGLADVFLDGALQLVPADSWCPGVRRGQVLYYRNGLSQGQHEVKLVARGARNPLSRGDLVRVSGVQFSAAEGSGGFGEGGGPRDAQRVIFGYAGRTDPVDSAGRSWRPATEFVVRAGALTDSVLASWWTERRRISVEGTGDPELYRYGAHARELAAHFTVGPGRYHVRVKLLETRNVAPKLRLLSIAIQGKEEVARMDIAATAGGLNRAVDLVFNDVRPEHGVISVRFSNPEGGEAIVQAIEVAPGGGGEGARPVTAER